MNADIPGSEFDPDMYGVTAVDISFSLPSPTHFRHSSVDCISDVVTLCFLPLSIRDQGF